jgi:enhancing lycopene biosynthesis protein 2
MKRFAIILSGCGVYDGAEIHEATMAMLAVCQSGNCYQAFAPDIEQHHVINHITGEAMPEKRNVLVEAARIARGNIKNLADFKVEDFDVLLFAGGFGVAKNFSDFAFKGADFTVIEQVKEIIKSMHAAKKPIGAMCISPLLLADAIEGVALTLGAKSDASTAAEKRGAMHTETTHGETVIDAHNKIVTTPAYMLGDANIEQIAKGAQNLVKELLVFA